VGSWTSFQIDGYQLLSTKSYADPDSLSVFREADKHVRLQALLGETLCVSPWLPLAVAEAAIRSGTDGRILVTLPEGATWELQEDEIEDREAAIDALSAEALLDPGNGFAGHAYVASVAEVRDRLDVMGFTRRATMRVLATHVANQLAEIESLLEEDGSDPYGIQQRDREALRDLTFDAWLEAFRWLKERGAHRVDERGEYTSNSWDGYFIAASETTPLIRYLLDENMEHQYGFPWDDVRYLYRAALEVCPAHGNVMLDLTDVTSAGYYTELQPVVEEASAAQIARHAANAVTIILTEGPTDQRALQGALRVLYPHLEELYSFMDFGTMRVRGGAPALVAIVKSFAGAGVANRVIALFDNDTAAHNALRDLSAIPLPPNIRVLTYPPLALAVTYPTLSPVGQQIADVNGAAASLEMYFGEDVLRDEHGEFTPVQWGSMDWGMQRYQGELRDKARLQARFDEKLAAARADPTVIESQDWSGMRTIIDAIRAAFP
jgi:hypothetical protein